MNESDKAALELAAAWAENLRKRVLKGAPDATPRAVAGIAHDIQSTIDGVLQGDKSDWLPDYPELQLRSGFVPLPQEDNDTDEGEEDPGDEGA
jgi:hypothetical protein